MLLYFSENASFYPLIYAYNWSLQHINPMSDYGNPKDSKLLQISFSVMLHNVEDQAKQTHLEVAPKVEHKLVQIYH